MADESSDGSEKDRNVPTVRDLKPGAPKDTVPDVFGVYVPPRPLPEVTPHRTIDIKPVRLSAAADPRQALTERRLVSPPRPEARHSTLWIAGGIVLLLGAGVWLFLRTPSSSSAPVAAPAASTLVRVSAAAVTAPAPLRSAPALAAVAPSGSASLPLASKTAPHSNLDAPLPASASPKAQGTRETAKKRKDPWLE